jgi:F-type H+-transporting ATPase subunit b
MEINPLTVLATIINFGILYLILRHFLFKPVNATISAREKEIRDRIDKSQEDAKQSELLRLENEEKLKSAREQGKFIVEDFKTRAEKVKADILAEAKQEAEILLERARKDAEREKEKVSEEIKTQAIELAILLSSKALEAKLDEVEHRRLIKDFITKVGV